MGFDKIDGLQAELQVVESEEKAQEIVKARLAAVEEEEQIANLEQKWEQENQDAAGKDRNKPVLSRSGNQCFVAIGLAVDCLRSQSAGAAEAIGPRVRGRAGQGRSRERGRQSD